MTKKPKKKPSTMKPKPRVWAPEKIYLTRNGWNDTYPEDGEVLWSETRITKKDVVYRRVRRTVKQAQLEEKQ